MRNRIIRNHAHTLSTSLPPPTPVLRSHCTPPPPGVLIIDRINGVVYVNVSERADASLAEEWTRKMGYKQLVTFR